MEGRREGGMGESSIKYMTYRAKSIFSTDSYLSMNLRNLGSKPALISNKVRTGGKGRG